MSIGLICLDTIWYDKTHNAIAKTLECISVDKIYWFSDIELEVDFGLPVVWTKIDKLTKANFMYENGLIYTKLMPSTITTDYGLYIHSDGFPVNKNAWEDDFLSYDYIGAPWPFYPEHQNVGNGGFCIKSAKLHKAILDLQIDDYLLYEYPEDNIICRFFRPILEEKYGIKFAPEDIACKFSMETPYTYPKQAYNYWIGKSFGFHNTELCRYYGFDPKQLK